MARIPKDSWILALRALCGSESELSYNETVGRWVFMLPSADGKLRAQFWGWLYRKHADGSRTYLDPDPVTGLHAFRDLDDDAMTEVLENLTVSYIGNPFNGAGTTKREMMRRHRFNRDRKQAHYRHAGEMFADMAIERGRRLRGAPQITVPVVIGGKK